MRRGHGNETWQEGPSGQNGYPVTAIDSSATLIEHAREADPEGDYQIADGANLPLPDGSVELVTAFMSLHDMDNLNGAIAEAARVLNANGHLCIAIVHPLNSAGMFESRTPDAPFIIRGSYFEDRRYADTVERDGLRMTFTKPPPAASELLRCAGDRWYGRGAARRGARSERSARRPVAAPSALSPHSSAASVETGSQARAR